MEAFRFRVDGKHFENVALRKRWRHDNHVIFLAEFSSNTNPKCPVINLFFYIPPALCGQKSFDEFPERNLSVSQFHRFSVVGAL